MFNSGHRLFSTFIACIVLTCTFPVAAQDQGDAESALDDFIHYSLVANVEFAEAYAMSLLRDNMSDEDFYNLVNAEKSRQERFDRAIGWARFVHELEPLAAKLEEKYEAGRTAVIRDSARLNESIEMLGGSTRQRLLAKNRLIEAGEYAVPPLLRSLNGNSDARNARNVQDMLTSIGRDAVLPLTTALPHLSDENQVLVAKTLGDIRYIHSLPTLNEIVHDDNSSASVRHAAAQAVAQIGFEPNEDLSTLNTIVSQQFYDGDESVMPRAIDGYNIYWSWDPAHGLTASDVPAHVFNDIMAMHYASKALAQNNENISAMSVFVAANLRRDRNLAGETDLVYGNLAYSPAFYATVFGPEIAQHVLAKSLIDKDTALALDAIGALSRTAGSSVLAGSDQPLVTAMFYPDRRVQYESAMTLGSTLPTLAFAGDYRVVPLLASAVRSGDELFAIVIGDDPEARRDINMFLERNGWSAVGEGTSAAEAIDLAGVVPGIDLAVVIPRSADQGVAIRKDLGAAPETTVTPILTLSDGADLQVLTIALGEDDMVETANVGISDSAKLAVLEDLLASASGGRLSADESDEYALRAISVLRDIALAETALTIDDATGTLIDALESANDETRPLIAETLSLIYSGVAQQALINAALQDGAVEDRVMLLDYAAASVRHWGNHADNWQVDAIVNLTETSSGYLADAAARLNGALDHPNTSVMTFIPAE